MADVHCARCDRTAPGLERPPLPGEDGAAVRSRVCADCWKGWLGEQVKLINETRISPADPDGYRFLLTQMRAYLHLAGDDEDGAAGSRA
jgi:Fe-S cluster biosynthesis and repair protein YggX